VGNIELRYGKTNGGRKNRAFIADYETALKLEQVGFFARVKLQQKKRICEMEAG